MSGGEITSSSDSLCTHLNYTICVVCSALCCHCHFFSSFFNHKFVYFNLKLTNIVRMPFVNTFELHYLDHLGLLNHLKH